MTILRNKSAVVLILVLFILLLFSFLTLIAVNLISKQPEPFIYHLNSIKALYLAEAGMNYFKEYRLLWDSTFTSSSLTINLGTANSVPNNNQKFTISVTPTTTRRATVNVTGIADLGSAFEVRRDIRIIFRENTDSAKSPMPSFRIVNGYFGDPSSTDIGSPSSAPPWPEFYANVYFNSSGLAPSAFLSHRAGVVGSVGSPRNIYLEENYDNSVDIVITGTTQPCSWGNHTLRTIFGNCYVKENLKECGADLILGTAYCANPPTLNCSNPIPPGTPWPSKPSITTTYYERMLAVAQAKTSSTPWAFLGNTFLMNGANFYFNADVLFLSMGGSGPILLGPGNLVTNRDMILQGGAATPTIIGAKIGLIANTISIQDAARIGGTNIDANNLITDPGGARFYVRGNGAANTFDLISSSGPAIKGVILVPPGANNNNSTRLAGAQIQGTIYTNSLYQDFGIIDGFVYTNFVCNATGITGQPIYEQVLRDIIPYTAGDKNTIDELPLEIKGLNLMRPLSAANANLPTYN